MGEEEREGGRSKGEREGAGGREGERDGGKRKEGRKQRESTKKAVVLVWNPFGEQVHYCESGAGNAINSLPQPKELSPTQPAPTSRALEWLSPASSPICSPPACCPLPLPAIPTSQLGLARSPGWLVTSLELMW